MLMEFTIFLQNVRSIHKNFELLEVLIESVQFKPTVIALTERWCKENCSPNAYNLNGYGKLLRCDRETRGGVVALYVGNKYESNEVKKTTNKHVQVLTTQLHSEKERIYVTVLYKAPNYAIDNFVEVLGTHLTDLNTLDYTHIVCNDFNVDMLISSRNAEKVCDYFRLLGLELCFNQGFCTRETRQSKTAIDLFFFKH